MGGRRIAGEPDPRPVRRTKDSDAVAVARLRGDECVACGHGDRRLSIHHVLYGVDGRDDDVRNLLLLCGDGTTGCHGAFHMSDPNVRRRIGLAIAARRETIEFVIERLGGEQGRDYLRRRYLMFDRELAWTPEPRLISDAWTRASPRKESV